MLSFTFLEESEMAKVVVYGADRLASLVHFYLKHESPHEVVGFVTRRRSHPLRPASVGEFEGLPDVPLEQLEQVFGPDEVACFAPRRRGEERGGPAGYELLKARGYEFVTFTSPGAVVSRDAEIGENCLILENCTIQPFVRIGHDVTLGAGCHIGHHSEIGDHVEIGPGVVVGSGCIIEPHGVLEAGAAIADCRRIGRGALIGKNAVVHENAKAGGVYRGPAAIRSKTSSHEIYASAGQ
ncbi:MAG: acetyltransferase [Planctomycetes bacterium]|nr:acetyltransferase [Planctomycetota bacterium]